MQRDFNNYINFHCMCSQRYRVIQIYGATGKKSVKVIGRNGDRTH